MSKLLNQLLDSLSEFLAARKGLLPAIGVLLVIMNFVLKFIPGAVILRAAAELDLFLHLGVVLAVIGIMLAWAL